MDLITNRPQENLAPGTDIDGRFTVQSFLGRGGYASVYLCTDATVPSLSVAMKLFPAALLSDPASFRRFSREIKALLRVDHPHVVRVYQPLQTERYVGFTMEFVPGSSLRALLKERGRLPVGDVVSVLMQVSSGILSLHKHRIIHRDLKPDNILVTTDYVAKIADLGISRIVEERETVTEDQPDFFTLLDGSRDSSRSLGTRKSRAIGTIGYLSPEYMRSGSVTFQSDLYAIGIIGFELLSGEHPFGAGATSAEEVVRAQFSSELPLLRERFPDIPVSLEKVVRKAAARNPEERYRSAQHLLTDLISVRGEVERAYRSEKKEISEFDVAVAVSSSRSRGFWSLRELLMGIEEGTTISLQNLSVVLLAFAVLCAISTLLMMAGGDAPRDQPDEQSAVEPSEFPDLAATTASTPQAAPTAGARFFGPEKGKTKARTVPSEKKGVPMERQKAPSAPQKSTKMKPGSVDSLARRNKSLQ